MQVWKLTPVDLSDPNWNASSHRGLVIVRAQSESAARALAAKAFDTAIRFPPHATIVVPPWTRASCVKAERITDKRYPSRGPAEILEPVL
jgi:hypothetical protein